MNTRRAKKDENAHKCQNIVILQTCLKALAENAAKLFISVEKGLTTKVWVMKSGTGI